MPQFSSAPPPERAGHSLRLLRTPVGKPYTGIITCHDLVGCPTHFYHHRTIPCEDHDCPACEAGYPWRWHGYLSCYAIRSHEHSLFELTAQAVEPIKDYRERHRTLRGCMFEAHRLGTNANGRVIVRCTPADLNSLILPDPPNLIAALCHIWSVPDPSVSTDGLLKDIPRLHIERPADGNGQHINASTKPA